MCSLIFLKPDDCAATCSFALEDASFPGSVSDYVILKRRYAINADGTLTPVVDTDSLQLSGDEYFADDIGESLKKVDDYLPPVNQYDLIIHGTAFKGFMHDVGQDFNIWQNKEYVHPPALAKGDGPVGQYRVWCKQFYPNKKEIIEQPEMVVA